MVGDLEMNRKASRKERFLKWWSVEGKIEFSAAAILLVFLIVFWGNPLMEGIAGISVAAWCLGKIYFRRDQWALLSLGAIWALYQGLSALFTYLRS